ncbi:MAG: hypothetical protein JWL70_2679 [Acidimicrobiia bacterium]|nr:hypothetical protein [Acidimicrobiia bacterium]
MELAAVDSLTAVLDSLQIAHEPAAPPADLILHFDAVTFSVEVEATAYATVERVRTMTKRRHRPGVTPVLVADHITDEARHDLTTAGWSWLDRRGHLYLRSAGLMIDRVVAATAPRAASARRPPIAGGAGIAVAYSILLSPQEALAVRPTAARIGFSPASVSTARARLRDAGLLEADGSAVLPELFWALADQWAPRPRG